MCSTCTCAWSPELKFPVHIFHAANAKMLEASRVLDSKAVVNFAESSVNFQEKCDVNKLFRRRSILWFSLCFRASINLSSEAFRRPPLTQSSPLLAKIFKEYPTSRLQSYVESGCCHMAAETARCQKCTTAMFYTYESLPFLLIAFLNSGFNVRNIYKQPLILCILSSSFAYWVVIIQVSIEIGRLILVSSKGFLSLKVWFTKGRVYTAAIVSDWATCRLQWMRRSGT